MGINFNPENPIGVYRRIVAQKPRSLPPLSARVGMTALPVISSVTRNPCFERSERSCKIPHIRSE